MKQTNIKAAIKKVSKLGSELADLDEELRDNEEVVLAAIENHPPSFRYASDRLKGNKNIVFEAFK